MVIYRIKVRDADGVDIGEFQHIKRLRFGKRLNNYGTCEFSIPANDERASTLVALRRYSVWIFREEDGESVLLWSGEQALRLGELKADENNWVTIFCFDWFQLLNNRFTSEFVRYEQIDAGEIALDLIDGAFGITEGEIEETVPRDRSYYNNNVMQAIIDLSNVLSGFDFEINNFKKLNIRTTIGVDRTESVILDYGHNVTSVRIEEDFSNPVTRGIVIGQAQDEDSLVRYEEDDAEGQALYGVREMVSTEMDISEIETFQDKALAMLRKYRSPLLKVDLEIAPAIPPKITDFSLGDLIRVKVNSGVYAIDEQYRVFEWQVTWDSTNTEKVSLVLGNFTLDQEIGVS